MRLLDETPAIVNGKPLEPLPVREIDDSLFVPLAASPKGYVIEAGTNARFEVVATEPRLIVKDHHGKHHSIMRGLKHLYRRAK